KQLEPDEKSLQRIFVELVAAAEDVFEHLAVLRQVAQQQALGQLALVLEMVEEAALGDTGCRDQLLDGGGGETLGEDGAFCKLEQALAGVAAFPWNIVEHGQLYHECSSFPRTARIRRAPALSHSKTTKKITCPLDHESAYAPAACAVGLALKQS